MGPILLFDKSFLQSLTLDESVWLDAFFLTNVCPMFYVETLADIAKEGTKGRNAADEVRIIADKFPVLSSAPCAHHHDMVVSSLLGYDVPMTGQIPLSHGRLVQSGGELGLVSGESPVAAAFARWQEKQFLEVEHAFASAWRQGLTSLDLKPAIRALRTLGIEPTEAKRLPEARQRAGELLRLPIRDDSHLESLLSIVSIQSSQHPRVFRRWKDTGATLLHDFAPYAAFLLEVEVFFVIAASAGLEFTRRPSTHVDVAYLYYLPFCMVFASSDRFHRQIAPLFLRPDQEFVWGQDLKQALRWLNGHFSAYPDEEKAAGVMALARTLPENAPDILVQMWNRHLPSRKIGADHGPAKSTPRLDSFIEKARQMEAAPTASPDPETFHTGDVQRVLIKRKVPGKKGSWYLVPPQDKSEVPGQGA